MITTAIITAVWNIVFPLLMRIPTIGINYDGLANTPFISSCRQVCICCLLIRLQRFSVL